MFTVYRRYTLEVIPSEGRLEKVIEAINQTLNILFSKKQVEWLPEKPQFLKSPTQFTLIPLGPRSFKVVFPLPYSTYNSSAHERFLAELRTRITAEDVCGYRF